MGEPASKMSPPPVHLSVQLELPDRPKKEFSYDFRQTVISLGRDPTNDIQIPLTTVSRNHARIFWEMGDFFLEDLGSTHGTEHNGRKIGKGEKKMLRDGDSIRVMSFSILFKTTAGTPLDRQPGEKTEMLARRMVQEVLSSLGGSKLEAPSLRIMNGPDEGKRYELAEEASEITIGRSPECDVCLDDHNASRRHCLIKRNWHGFTAQDLGSKNGVLCNGKQIEGAQLIKDGDELQIGGVKLIFIDPPSRLLEQMGGLDNATMDPTGEPPAAPDPAEAEEPEPEYEAPPPSARRAPEPEPHEEPAAEDPADAPVDPAVAVEAPPLAKKGLAWEVLILVIGGLFLIAAVGLIAFLVL